MTGGELMLFSRKRSHPPKQPEVSQARPFVTRVGLTVLVHIPRPPNKPQRLDDTLDFAQLENACCAIQRPFQNMFAF